MGMAFPIWAASPGEIFDPDLELAYSTAVPFFSLLPPLEEVEEELSFMASIRAASPDDTRGESPPFASDTLPPPLSLLPPPAEATFPAAGGVDDAGGPAEGLDGKAEDLLLPLPLRAAILSAMLELPPLLEGPFNRTVTRPKVKIETSEVGSMKMSNIEGRHKSRKIARQVLSRG